MAKNKRVDAMLWIGVGVRMEQLRQIFNLRNVLISETHAPVFACVGAIMCISRPVQRLVYIYKYGHRNHGQTRGALMVV